MLIIDGVKYKLWIPKDEEREFHPMVKMHSEEIFGEDSIYFDVKHKLKSRSGIGSIPDAYVIKLSKPYEWYVIENELATHPIYDHIVKQLTKFMNGLKNPKSRQDILEALDEEISSDSVLKTYVEKTIGSLQTYRFMSKLLSRFPKIVVVIDELSEEVKEACESLKYPIQFVEFKTFVREDAENVRAHLFEPISTSRVISEKRRGAEIGRRPLPEHYGSWEKMLAWVDENTSNIAKQITLDITKKLKNVVGLARGRNLCFYKGKPSTKSIFAAFLLTKKYLKVRIRTDPTTFRDPKKRVNEKVYKGWFFKTGQEREFKISAYDTENLTYAIELIKQSYALAK